jgi:hypothetical protein
VNKKKQKNFDFFDVALPLPHRREAEQKFFWFFFFKKRTSAFLISLARSWSRRVSYLRLTEGSKPHGNPHHQTLH